MGDQQVIFHLRKGVTWQEKPGVMKAREFVVDDVVYRMERLKNTRRAIPDHLSFIDRSMAMRMDTKPFDDIRRMSRKNHSSGFFHTNGHGTPIEGIRKNFVTGQLWNPHMMSDPSIWTRPWKKSQKTRT
jgi:ABC-type transport system substrate-binding protein